MNDRELLEMAAKAAGIEIVDCACRYEEWPFKYAEGQGRRGHWNPLTDDGDALRLAVKCDISIIQSGATRVCEDVDGKHLADEVDTEGDGLLATRRAIVRAAAEIGRSMP
jgi:hypothetical protein